MQATAWLLLTVLLVQVFFLDPTTLAYVTYQDIRSLRSLDDQTVIAIKAPPETRLEVPDPKKVTV